MKHTYNVDQLERMQNNPWLTDREREVFELYYRRGWAIEDVAAELYVSRNTVNNTLYSLRHKTIPSS
jgi:DNA-binding NarL/FixJ family response regulator